MKLYRDNIETLNDWRQASALFLGNSEFSAFFELFDSYKEDSYRKTA